MFQTYKNRVYIVYGIQENMELQKILQYVETRFRTRCFHHWKINNGKAKCRNDWTGDSIVIADGAQTE